MILVKKNLVEATLPPLLQSEGSKLPLYQVSAFFFGVSCHPKDISLFFVVYKVTQSSAFFSVIEHLFFSPLSIIVTVLW